MSDGVVEEVDVAVKSVALWWEMKSKCVVVVVFVVVLVVVVVKVGFWGHWVVVVVVFWLGVE